MRMKNEGLMPEKNEYPTGISRGKMGDWLHNGDECRRLQLRSYVCSMNG